MQFASFDPAKVKSTPQVRTDLFGRKLDQVLLTDFFGSVRNIELLNQTSIGREGEGVESTSEGRSKQEGGMESNLAASRGETSFPRGHYLSPQDSLVRSYVWRRAPDLSVPVHRTFLWKSWG